MRKFTMTLAAAAAVLVTINMSANAQASAGAGIHALVQNSTPIVKQVACQGPGPYCGPGYVRACRPYRCGCRPCTRSHIRVLGEAAFGGLSLFDSRVRHRRVARSIAGR